MNSKLKKMNEKGETNSNYIFMGVVITLLVIFGIKYYSDHRDDVVIHPPHIDVH